MSGVTKDISPFTEDYRFTGPHVAISCRVEWDSAKEEYHATSAGFHGVGLTEIEAALACFSAWMAVRRGWHDSDVPNNPQDSAE